MDISPIKNFGINNIFQIKQQQPFFGLKMTAPLSKDAVSFTSRLKGHFDSKAEAYEYYKKIAQNINTSLQEEDDLTAFETLGYEVDSDFETDEITIKGDYKPFFDITVGASYRQDTVSYKEANIDEERLLQNVKEITGKRFVASSFVPNDDYKIDSKMLYPKKVEDRIEKLLEKRTKEAKDALALFEYEKALNILGYETEADENGDITIKGNYSPILLTKSTSDKTLKDYGIDENVLLARVVQIDGDAEFSEDYKPEHHIQLKSKKVLTRDYVKEKEINNAFVRVNPEFQAKLADVKAALSNKDSYGALKTIGYDVSLDENSKITINGNYYTGMGLNTSLFNPFTFSELGIDEKELLKDVVKVDGDMVLSFSDIKKLSKDIEVTGRMMIPSKANPDEFFEEFMPLSRVSATYDIDEAILQRFVDGGALKASVKTSGGSYFKAIEGESKAFLDELAARRDEVLTTAELQAKYGVSELSIRNATRNGLLRPYKMEDFALQYSENAKSLMFDTTDTANEAGLKRLENNGKYSSKKAPTTIKDSIFAQACEKYSVRPLHKNSTKAFHSEDIERLGYGSKAELVANCGLRVNAYRIKQEILACDIYDISSPVMADILSRSKKNNPACVKLGDIQRKLSSQTHKDYFKQGIIDGKMNIITEDPFRIIYRNDYMVDLSDEKNAEFLKTIEDESFKAWLSGKFDQIEAYRASVDEELEAFLSSKAPTQKEEAEYIQRQIRELEAKRNLEALAKKQQAKEKQEERFRNISLRATIAWVLCSNTRQIKRELVNSHLQNIFRKNNELKQIQEQLLAHEITLEEAEAKIKALNLTKQDEIDVLSYHKTCWDIAGTKEWSESLKKATLIASQYNEFGIDSIEDAEIKERLIRWESERKK